MKIYKKNLVMNLFSFIWNFLKDYKSQIYGIYLAIFILSILTVVDPLLLKILIDKIIKDKDNFNILYNINYVSLVIIFILIHLCGNLTWRVVNYLSLKTFPSIRSKIFSETFNYVSLHSHQYFQDNLTGDLANKVQDIGKSIEDIFEPLSSIAYVIFIILITIIVTYTISPYFSLALFIWVVIFIGISLFLSKLIIVHSKDFAEVRSFANGKYVDSLMNIFNVHIFARHKYEKNYLKKISNKVVEKDINLRFKLLKLWAIQGVLCTLILGIMIFILMFLKMRGIVSVGDFVFIISVTITVIQQVFGIAELISRVIEQIGILNQAVFLIYQPHTITDMIGAQPINIKAPEIIFKNVTFWYKKENILFKDLDLFIGANQKIGLAGYSGSGKTSFINLLIRLYEVQSGEIQIDKQNIKTITIASLRENVTFIPQNPILFHRSFMDNIIYGKLSATKQEVIEAAKKAHAHEFIMDTCDGYDSLIGENGVKISGGQRQRIAIARAILKNAPILILDEATSSLDSITELLIQDSLKQLMKNKTVITIAHRLSTLLAMDRILVFDKGRIIEDGAHNELIEKQGLYFKLWNSQVGGFKEIIERS